MRACHQNIVSDHKSCSKDESRNSRTVSIIAVRFPNGANNSDRLQCYFCVFNLFVFFILIVYYLESSKDITAVFWFKIPIIFLTILVVIHQIKIITNHQENYAFTLQEIILILFLKMITDILLITPIYF